MTTKNETGNKIISKRYADALISTDCANTTKEEILAQLYDIKKTFNNSEDLRNVMESPVITENEKKELLAKIFKGFDNNLVNFLKLLIDKKRFSILNSIIDEYKHIIDEQNNILDIKITSAIDLNDSEKAMIKIKVQKVLNRNVEIKWDVNNDIIGGLTFEINDNIIDCSLLSKLQGIQRKIII